jgi:hypothetical protein
LKIPCVKSGVTKKEEDKIQPPSDQAPSKTSKRKKSKAAKEPMQLSVNAPIFIPIFTANNNA